MNYYVEVLKKYAVFSGRARRAEFWYYTLITLVISLGISMLGGIMRVTHLASWVDFIYGLAVLAPGLGVSFRRLHDIGRTAWWLLIWFIPVIGTIVLIVFFCLDSAPGDNKYGPNPKGVSAQPASTHSATPPSQPA